MLKEIYESLVEDYKSLKRVLRPTFFADYETHSEPLIDTKEDEIVITCIETSKKDYDKLCEKIHKQVGFAIRLITDIDGYPFGELEKILRCSDTIIIGDNFAKAEILKLFIDNAPCPILTVTKEKSDSNNYLDITDDEIDNSVDVISTRANKRRLTRLKKEMKTVVTDFFETIPDVESICKNGNSLLELFRAKDEVTYNHVIGVLQLSSVMLQGMEMEGYEFSIEEKNNFEAAALLHDLGKLFIPDQLLKNNDRFSVGEFAVMKMHVDIPEFLSLNETQRRIMDVASKHHYRYDGAGYPKQDVKGDDIPLGARMLTVIDSFEAMTSIDRPYTKTKPQSLEESLETLFNNSQERSEEFPRGGQFDPKCAYAFVLGFKKQFEMNPAFRRIWLDKELTKTPNMTVEEKLTSIETSLNNVLASFEIQKENNKKM